MTRSTSSWPPSPPGADAPWPPAEAERSCSWREGGPTVSFEGGAAGGPPLLLLHGFLTSSFTWRHVWGRLAGDHRLLALDLPGYGESQPVGEAPSIDDYARALDGVFEERGLSAATVVGTAMGGSIAAWFAYRYPHRVRRLVLMAAGGMGETSRNLWLFRLLATRRPGGAICRHFPRGLFAKLWRAAYDRAEVATDPVVDVYLRGLRASGDMQMRIGLRVRASYDETYAAAMRRILAPTLLVWGEDDRVVPLCYAERYLATIPRARLVVVPRCGDFPQEEQPGRVSDVIREFVADDGGFAPGPPVSASPTLGDNGGSCD